MFSCWIIIVYKLNIYGGQWRQNYTELIYKRTTYKSLDFSGEKIMFIQFWNKESFYFCITQKWLWLDHKQSRYLTQKCDTHQIWIRIVRGHFQSQIFAK